MRSKRAIACDISKKVKNAVWLRDNGCCIFCGSPCAMPNVHVVPRSKGGLGIEKNVVTGCVVCHKRLDHTLARRKMLLHARTYLESIYGPISEDEVIYKKGY